MSVEVGGRAGKLGDSFERRWAIKYALLMLAGQIRRLRWEPVGSGAAGVDLEIECSDGAIEGHQLKRQNRSDGRWTVADLDREGVLQTARAFLQRYSSGRFCFVSSDPAIHLKDIADRIGRDPESVDLFLQEHIGTNANRKKAYSALLRRWNLNPEVAGDNQEAFELLLRLRFELVDRGEGFRRELVHLAALQLTGDPEVAIAVVGQYLEDRLGQNVYPDELLAFLKSKGYSPRDISREPGLAATVAALRDRFLARLRARLIRGAVLCRGEGTKLLERVQGELPPRLVLIHGRAGCGKSAFLYQLCDRLTGLGVPCLPWQFHLNRPSGSSPYRFGRDILELPSSPAHSLEGLAAGRQAVLMLDQIDALRLTTAHSHAAWECCARIVEEALVTPSVTVVVACRTFDLENDLNIRKWRETVTQRLKEECEEVHLGDLDEASVASVTQSFGVEFSSLSPRTRRLLCHPMTLSMWCDLASRGQVTHEFGTATELRRTYLRDCRKEACTEHGVSEDEVGWVVETLVRRMEGTGKLDAPEAVVARSSRAVDALCSVGVLIGDDGAISFAHQSLFDHLVAEHVIARVGSDVESLVTWVKDNQSLFRREQLRCLLFMLRDSQQAVYAKLVRAVLSQSEIRFHLKHLTLGVLREGDPPTGGEVELVVDLAGDGGLWEHLRTRVLWKQLAWFDALNARSVWTNWLTTTDVGRLRHVLGLLGSVAGERGAEVDALLEPYWDRCGAWQEHLAYVMPWDAAEDSPHMAELRRRNVRQGKWFISDVFLSRVAESDPDRVVPLLEAAIRNALKGALMRNDSKRRRWRLQPQILEKAVFGAVRTNGVCGWRRFGRLLRFVVRLEARRKASLTTAGGLLRADYGTWHAFNEAKDLLERVVAESVRGIATGSVDELYDVLAASDKRAVTEIDRAIAAGLDTGPSHLADIVVEWLCRKLQRFRMGDGQRMIPWGPARDLIRRFSPHCSERLFNQLQESIISYHDPGEAESFKWRHERAGARYNVRNEWGRAQNVLLNALDATRMSVKARELARTWRHKFGDPSRERPTGETAIGGRVTSSIPQERIGAVSDAMWIRIATGEWPRNGLASMRQVDSDTVAETSHRQFARAFADAAKKEPRRFARLALGMPKDVPIDYFADLLWELAGTNAPDATSDWEPATAQDISALVAHVGPHANHQYARAISHAMEARAEDDWPLRMYDVLCAYASHPDPEQRDPSRGPMGEANGNEVSDIAGTGINSVRGSVAGAIRSLVWHRWDRASRLLPTAEKLLSDPHPAVRQVAIGICLAVLNHDRDMAVDMFLTACGHPDDRVLRSRWVGQMVSYARWTHRERIEPIVWRMADSQDDAVAEAGATWAIAITLQQSALVDLTDQCVRGRSAQRKGVADAARQLYTDEKLAPAAGSMLMSLFDDEHVDVRAEAADVFRRHDSLQQHGAPTLALRFVESRAFKENAEDLILALTEHGGDLFRFRETILVAADRFAVELADQTRSLQERLGFVGKDMSLLLLRLYDHAYREEDSELLKRCLDRWDAMLAARVGEAERHLESLDT